MKKDELKQLSEKELQVKINESRNELVHLRLRKQTGQVEKPHRLRVIKRDIARLETYLTQKKSDKPAATAA